MNKVKKSILNEKGFTLIELLAAIFIISLIMVIAVPMTERVIKQARQEMYEKQLNNIILGAKNWGAKNFMFLPEEEGGVITLMLGELKSSGFVDEKIINPKTKKLFPNDLEITITKKMNDYEYLIKEDFNS